MSFKNIGAPFYHSCLKTPVNPKNNFPCPSHERNSWATNSLKENIKHSNYQSSIDNNKDPKMNNIINKNSLDSIIDFYENIPDYKDMVHLSNREFYTQLENLKEKQRIYFQSLEKTNENDGKSKKKFPFKTDSDEKMSHEILEESYNSANSSKICFKKNNSTNKKKTKKSRILQFSDSNSQSSIESRLKKNFRNKKDVKYSPSEYEIKKDFCEKKDIVERPVSSKTNGLSSSRTYSHLDSILDQLNFEDFISSTESEIESFITPSQKVKTVAWEDPKITVPKPFKMTIREEEDKEINQLQNEFLENENKRKLKIKNKKGFKANPVPYHTKIPLFDKIMEEQERRSQRIRSASKAELEAQMQPFSFVERDEAQRKAHIYRTRSTPDLRQAHRSGFRARPIPKSLFTGLAYQRMREQEYLRLLNKKIRAEELLRSSSLPPSMAAREEINKLLGPPTSEEIHSNKDLNSDLDPRPLIKRRSRARQRRNKMHCMPNFTRSHAKIEQELQERKNSNISTSTEPFKLHMSLRKCRTTSTSPRDSDRSPYGQNLTGSSIPRRPRTSLGLPLNRNNLAAVLRIQSAKERLERDAMERQEEAQKRTDARIRAQMERQRRSAAWASLDTLCPPVRTDVHRRVLMRREEERLRRDEYLYDMELMYHRVQEIPTLFERQTKKQKQIRQNQDRQKNNYYKYNYENENFENEIMTNSLEDLERKSPLMVKLNGNSIHSDKSLEEKNNGEHSKLKISTEKVEKSGENKTKNKSKNSSEKCTGSGSLENSHSSSQSKINEENISNKISSENSKSKKERKSATYQLSEKSSSIDEVIKTDSNHSEGKKESEHKKNGKNSNHSNGDHKDEDDVVFEKSKNKKENEENTGSELDDFYDD